MKCVGCNKESVNVGDTLCEDHLQEYRKAQATLKWLNRKRISEQDVEALGLGCPYCGTITEGVCCGEMHHEELWSVNDEILTETELHDRYVID
jgi:hypothetical protein